MKKLFLFITVLILLQLTFCNEAMPQTVPTPNIGLQLPAYHSNNWNIPLNFNFTQLDLMLSGNAPIPGLKITGNLQVGGSININTLIANTLKLNSLPNAGGLGTDGSGNFVIKNPFVSSLTTSGTGGAATVASGVLNIPQYQCALTLTTTGSSGPATLSGCTLNIPQYTGGGGGGGYTNVNGSTSETTVSALNSNCGSGTLYATTPLSIATGGTITCPVQFSKSGLWTISSGQTITFASPVTETDGPSQHFSGSGTVVLAPQDRWAEWWGATGVPNTSTPSFDSTSAINNCISSTTAGVCKLQPLSYEVTAPIVISSGGQGLVGSISSGGVTGLANYTEIISTSTTADIIDAHGPSAFIAGNVLENLFLRRSSNVTSSLAAGVSDIFTDHMKMRDIVSNDSARNFYFSFAANVDNSNLVSQLCQYTNFTGVSNAYGYYIDGEQDSLYGTNWISIGSCSSTITHGVYTNAAIDLSLDGVNTFGVNYGLHLDNGGDDIIARNIVTDQTKTAGILASGSFSNSSVSEGRIADPSGSNNTAIDLETVQHLILSNLTVRGDYTVGSVWLEQSTHNVVTGLTVNDCGTSGLCMGLDNHSDNNVITSNSLNSTSTGLKLTNSSFNQISGNQFGSGQGGGTAYLFLDSNSNHNHWANNNAFATTTGTLISDAGTDNQFSTGSINGLTNISGTITPTGMTCSSSSCATTGTVASITFGGLGSACSGNILRIVAFPINSTGQDGLHMQFNSDSTSGNYAYDGYQSINGGINGVHNTSPVSSMLVGFMGTSGQSSQTTIDIPFFNLGTLPRVFQSQTTLEAAFTGSSSLNTMGNFSGAWSGTGAITSITLLPGSNNFVSGSTFIAYCVN